MNLEYWSCGCGEQETRLHTEHEYYVSYFNDASEDLTCSICGNVSNREHVLDDGVKGAIDCETIYSCTNDGCNYSKNSFLHAYKAGDLISYNGTNEEYCYKIPYTCVGCGDTYEENRPHKLYSKTIKSGTLTMCTNSNCNYQKFIPAETEESSEDATGENSVQLVQNKVTKTVSKKTQKK